MPLQLRDTYARIPRCMSEPVRSQLQRQARQLRQKWVADMRRKRLEERVAAGGAICRTKKLFPIESMCLTEHSGHSQSGLVSSDRALWKTEVQSHYEHKWGAHRSDERMSILDFVLKYEGAGLAFSLEQWDSAIMSMKSRARCDHYGVSVAFLGLLLQAQPVKTVAFLNSFLQSSPMMSGLEIHGRV